MRYVAAYLLAVLGGNTSPSAKDIKNILGSVGIEADDERLNKVSPPPPFKACDFQTFIIQVVLHIGIMWLCGILLEVHCKAAL